MSLSHAVPNTVEPILFEAVKVFLIERGFRCSGTKYVMRGWMAPDKNTHMEFTIIRKNYAVEWLYEIHFSINWLDIFRLYALSEGALDVKNWKKYAVIATGTPRRDVNKKWDRNIFKFSKVSDVDRLVDSVCGIIDDVAEPFFRKWKAYINLKEEFYRHTDAARSVTLTPSTLSAVAIAIAAIHDRDRVEEIIQVQREFVGGFEGRNVERIENYVSELRSRGLI